MHVIGPIPVMTARLRFMRVTFALAYASTSFMLVQVLLVMLWMKKSPMIGFMIGASGRKRNRKSCEIATSTPISTFGKCPNDAHSFCPGFQMMETNFELVSRSMICSEVQEIGMPERVAAIITKFAIVAALQKSDVAIMRQDFWPQFQVGGCFEDHYLRRLHEDRVYSVHGMASVRWKPARPAMLRNFRGTMDSSPKSILVKEKTRLPSIREQAVAGGNESAYPQSEGRGLNPYLRFGRVESAGTSLTPRVAASAACASWVINAKNACDWPMKRPMAVRNRKSAHGSALSIRRPNDRNISAGFDLGMGMARA